MSSIQHAENGFDQTNSAHRADTGAAAGQGATGKDAARAGHLTDAQSAALRSTEARNAHDTGVSDSGRWSTRRIAIYALFVALAIVTSFIEVPLMPAMPWLKYDPSGIIVLIAGFAFGPSAASIVGVLGFAPHLLMDPWGALMAILVALGLGLPSAFIYRSHRSRKAAALGLVVGALVALAVAILGNLIITPIYAKMSVQAVAALIVPALLPFNLIKFAIDGIATYVIYKPVSNLLHR